jgi:hypothetical protein
MVICPPLLFANSATTTAKANKKANQSAPRML